MFFGAGTRYNDLLILITFKRPFITEAVEGDESDLWYWTALFIEHPERYLNAMQHKYLFNYFQSKFHGPTFQSFVSLPGAIKLINATPETVEKPVATEDLSF